MKKIIIFLILLSMILIIGCKKGYDTSSEAMAIKYNESIHKVHLCSLYFYSGNQTGNGISFTFWYERECNYLKNDCEREEDCRWSVTVGAHKSGNNPWYPTFDGRCSCAIEKPWWWD